MIIQPFQDPTCNFARFQAKLESQVGSDCGKNDLFKFITGQTKKEEYIYQVSGVKYVEKAEGYRAE